MSKPPSEAFSISTSVARALLPLFPADVSWYATPSPPSSNVSALIWPGRFAGDPDTGAEAGADVVVVVVVVVKEAGFARIVVSFVTWPGEAERYDAGLRST